MRLKIYLKKINKTVTKVIVGVPNRNFSLPKEKCEIIIKAGILKDRFFLFIRGRPKTIKNIKEFIFLN